MGETEIHPPLVKNTGKFIECTIINPALSLFDETSSFYWSAPKSS